MGSSPRRKIYLLGVAHPVMGKLNLFQVPEAHRAMRLTQDLNHEGMARNALFVIVVYGLETQVSFCSMWNKMYSFMYFCVKKKKKTNFGASQLGIRA